MKQIKIMAIMAIMLSTSSAFAQSVATSEVDGVSAGSQAIGNTAPINSGNVSRGSDLSNAVGMAVAPALTTTLTETYP